MAPLGRRNRAPDAPPRRRHEGADTRAQCRRTLRLHVHARERHLIQDAAIVGVGETTYYKRGESPDSEFALACQAVLAAAADAGLAIEALDGFSSYSDDRNDPVRLASALGIPEVHFASMVWGGGGGGVCGAVANAAAAVTSGLANHVVVYRSLAQG